jgi:O-antigen/teichoic acid export membrane protein
MRVLTNAAWLSLCRIVAEGSSFLLFVVVARAYGPAGTGEYSYAFAIASFVAFASGAGIDEFGVRQYVLSEPRARALNWANIVATQYVQLALALLAFVCALTLFGLRARTSVVLEASTMLVAQYVSRTFFVPAMAAQAMASPALIELGCRFTAIAVALLLILTARLPLPLALLGFPIMGGVLVCLAARNAAVHGASLRPHWNLAHLLDTARATIPFTVAELLSQFYARTDILLIAYLLGNERVGLYAMDVKFVEFGILPIFLLGSAAYPLLSRASASDSERFDRSADEFVRIVIFLGGWLAVGVTYVAPLIIPPLFGSQFSPAIAYLPLFGALALIKGCEAALYRLMYVTRRTSAYTGAIVAGVVVAIALNLTLVPMFGLLGAVIATVLSVCAVVGVCAWSMRRTLSIAMFIGAGLRAGFALAITVAVAQLALMLGTRAWISALIACLVYPTFGVLARLLPNPAHSWLLQPTESHATKRQP